MQTRPASAAPGRFFMATGIAFVLLAGLALFLLSAPLDERHVELVRYGTQLLSAAAAALSCAWAATQRVRRSRRAWTLVALAAACAVAGESVEVGYIVSSGSPAPFPSGADAGILAAFLLLIAGVLAFPGARGYAIGIRTVLDFAMFALSLAFIFGSVSPALGSAMGRHTTFEIVVAAAYPVFDVLLFTAIFVALRRSLAAHRPRVALLCLGLAVYALADSISPIVANMGVARLYVVSSAGAAFGFTLVALAPWVTRNDAAQQEDEPPLWQLMLPYAGVAAAGITAAYIWFTHGQIASWVSAPRAGLLAVLIASQMVQHWESRALLRQTKAAEATSRQRETMLNQIIEHAPQGVAALTETRTISSANARLYSILHTDAESLIGRSLDPFLDAEYVNGVFERLARRPAADDMYVSDCRARRADGSEFWLHWSVTPIRQKDGAIDYFMAMFDDVTARREAEETAVANLAQLEQLNRLKSEFVSTVSHEFRTGLVGIQGFSELIRDQPMEMKEARALANDINADAQRLSRLITEMLDFDRLEAGKVRLDLRRLDVNDLAEDALERARVAAPKHVVRAHLQPDLPDVLGDRDRLTQVLLNLLTNAVKYSPDGGEIGISTRAAGPGVEVTVTDHGRGIPPEFISRLFGRYERFEDRHAGKIIGTGLGLAIARQIVEMHGGTISVASVLGKGSEFRIILPAAVGRPTVPLEALGR